VASIEPSSGTTLGGTSVTIKGTGFLSGSTVTIGAAATSVVVVSEKEITAKTAAGAAGKDEVVVSYANGVASTGGPDYTYVTPPSVTSVTPAEGSTLGGTSLKIKGTGFVEGATVKIGSETTGVTVVSSTEITATTAATAAGKDEVVVTDEKGVSSGGSSFTYVAPPKVTSVEPSAGSTAGGTAVKIKGSGFLKGSTVKIGSEATSVVIVSETEITAKTAAGAAGKDEVVVTDVGGSSTEGPKFTYVTPPTVASVTPATGSTLGGTAVVLKGTGFLEGSTVTIGSKAVEVEVVSETEIKAKTAATAAGKDEVVVGYADGVVSTGGPTYAYVAPPKVTSISPTEGSTAGGTAVKIKGTGFLKGSTVAIGGGEATSVVVVSETEITAKTAATAAGKDEVVVSDTSGPSTAGPSFTFVTPPTVASIEPSSGTTLGGTSVTIKGTGFLSGSTVTIGATATSVVVVSEKEITAKTAAGAAGKDEVVVKTSGGIASSGGPEFTYVTPPSVTSVTPAEGSSDGGTSVVIKGTGFVTGATVKIGNEATGVTVVSSTEITATTAATAAGKDEVVVTDEKGVSSGGSSFTYVAPPTVTSITPNEGAPGGGTAVKIKGTGFKKGSTVTIGKAAKSVTVVSETEITATTPAHSAGEVEVEVEDEFGSSSSGPKFTFT